MTGTSRIVHVMVTSLATVKFSEWYESDDQFPKLHYSAKLGKTSGSVCTYI